MRAGGIFNSTDALGLGDWMDDFVNSNKCPDGSPREYNPVPMCRTCFSGGPTFKPCPCPSGNVWNEEKLACQAQPFVPPTVQAPPPSPGQTPSPIKLPVPAAAKQASSAISKPMSLGVPNELLVPVAGVIVVGAVAYLLFRRKR